MILRANKRLWVCMKIRERQWMFMFESMNEANTYYIQYMNICAQHKRRTSVRYKICWSHSIPRKIITCNKPRYENLY